VFRSLRLGCSFVGLVLTLAACGGSSSTPTPTNTPVHTGSNGGTNTGSTVYAPVKISVSFEGGSTTPTTIKTSTPKQFDGTLCATKDFTFGLGSQTYSDVGKVTYIYTFEQNCACSAYLFYCAPVGTLACTHADGLTPIHSCAKSPLLTPMSAVTQHLPPPQIDRTGPKRPGGV
jgi:hypothetical protein